MSKATRARVVQHGQYAYDDFYKQMLDAGWQWHHDRSAFVFHFADGTMRVFDPHELTEGEVNWVYWWVTQGMTPMPF